MTLKEAATAVLAELIIEDYALIERVHLRFGPGFNVLTGETGTGKSIIIDAVDLVLGARASREVVRTGAGQARLEAVFHRPPGDPVHERLQALGYPGDDGGMIVISREIARDDRNIGRINGRAATVADIRTVAGRLVDLHGQGEHQLLLRPAHQRQAVDRFGGDGIAEPLAAVRRAHAELRELEARRAQLVGGDARDRARHLDLLEFQLREIDAAALEEGEDERLRAERRRLAHADECRTAAGRAAAAIAGSGGAEGLVDSLQALLQELARAARFDEALEGLAGRLEGLVYELEDTGRELRRYQEGVAVDPERLQLVEDRLEAIRRLTRKYGDDVAAVLAFREAVAKELEELAAGEQLARELEQRCREAREHWARAAAELTRARREVAERLAAAMEEALQELGMDGGRFTVAVDRPVDGGEGGQSGGQSDGSDVAVLPDDGARVRPAPHGADTVTFHFNANPGEPLAPLARVASGGETARLMLALKSILADHEDVASLIFDEIETGIGGRVAHAVAARLAGIAARRQVISVTHLAAVAAVADHHFVIGKSLRGGRTVTGVAEATGEARVQELARMIGGNNEAIGLAHARTLLESAAGRS